MQDDPVRYKLQAVADSESKGDRGGPGSMSAAEKDYRDVALAKCDEQRQREQVIVQEAKLVCEAVAKYGKQSPEVGRYLDGLAMAVRVLPLPDDTE